MYVADLNWNAQLNGYLGIMMRDGVAVIWMDLVPVICITRLVREN